MERDSATTVWTDEDWEQARQAWRDWRDVITRHYDQGTNARLEQAWAAGLLDSEASYEVADDSPLPETPRELKLQIVQPFGKQGEMNLIRFQRAVDGAGTISGPREIGGHTCYVWRAAKKSDVEKIWKALGPFLGPVRFTTFRHALVTPDLRRLRSEPKPAGGKSPSKVGSEAVKEAKDSKASGQSTRSAHR
jgi:hypothetical protein